MRGAILGGLLILALACGDNGPEAGEIDGAWRLTSVGILPLPAQGTATGGEVWLAAILDVTGQTGFFDRCMRDPSGTTRVSRSTAVLVDPIDGDRVKVSYFERRVNLPDTATVNGGQLTLRYRDIVSDPPPVDVLTFVRMPGGRPEVCSLAP